MFAASDAKKGLAYGDFAGWVYTSTKEFDTGISRFLASCGASNDAVLVIAGQGAVDRVLERSRMLMPGVSIDGAAIDAFLDSKTGFAVEDMYSFLRDRREMTRENGRKGLRVFANLDWVVSREEGCSAVSELSVVFASFLSEGNSVVLAGCDRRIFSASLLLDVLPLFPLVAVGGSFVGNVCHSPVASRGSSERHSQILDLILNQLRKRMREISSSPSPITPRNTLKMLQSIIDSVGNGLLVVDHKGQMVFCNRTAEAILGFGMTDLPLPDRVRMFGNYLPDKTTVYPVEDLPIAKAIRGESVNEVEVFIKNENKPEGVSVRTTGRPLLDENGAVCGGVVMFRDVTEQKKAMERTALLEARIVQGQKLEGLGLLAGGIAHDFNNLLMGVLGNAGLALLEAPKGSDIHTRIEQVKIGAMRLSELTNQLLAYSGQGSFKEEPVDLSAIVEEMQNLLRTVVSKRAKFSGHFARPIPIILADATQVRQIVMNLITNASDALGDKAGRINVSTGTLFADREYLLQAYLSEHLSPGDYVYLEVSDDGCGMDVETQGRIFDPFYTTKKRGRGLGLAAVLGLVRRHGAALELNSMVGEGTTFRVLFPVLRGPELRQEKVEQVSEKFAGEGLIVVIDDEEVVRRVTRDILEFAGFKVVVGINGEDGIKVFEKYADEAKLVLLDMTMPDLRGEDVFERLRKIKPDVQIILSSGYSLSKRADHLLRRGNAAYLQKPYVPELLLSKIRELGGEVQAK